MERKWWTLIAVCLGTFMLLLDVTIVNVALPDIQTSLNATFSDLQWVVDAYALFLAALLLTTGSLADIFGRRRVFMVGLVIFSVSSLASGLATTPLWLNLARGAQGIGGAAMYSTSLALLGSSFQGRERGVAFGAWGAITGLAVAVGPVVGGALTTGLSWRWIFLVNVPIGVIGMIVCLARVDESRQSHARRPDLIGVVTFSGSLGALVYALIKGNAKGWGSPVILACLIGAAVLMIAFLVAEWAQGERAMFDLSLLRKPTFTGGLLAAFAISAGLFSLLLYLTLYLQDVLGYSAIQTGLRLLVLSGGILLTSTLAGRLTAVVPIRFLIGPGLALVGIGLFLMRGLSPSSGWTHLIPGFIVAGTGVGFINPPLASTAIGVVPPERGGMASGMNSTFRQIGIATGIAGLGSIFSHTVSTKIVSLLSGAPGITAGQAHSLATGVAQGNGARAGLGALAPQARGAAVHAVRTGFVSGLNTVFLIGGLLALVSAVLTTILIRSKDFESSSARGGPAPSGPGGTALPDAAATHDAERATEPTAPAEPAPAEPAPESVAEPALRSESGESPEQDVSALAIAAEQAARDYRRQLDRQADEHREAELAEAEREARALFEAAHARSDKFEAELRRREHQLEAERERLVSELRDRLASADSDAGRAEDGESAERAEGLVQARARLYRLIGELGEATADEFGRPDRDGDRNGGDGSTRPGVSPSAGANGGLSDASTERAEDVVETDR